MNIEIGINPDAVIDQILDEIDPVVMDIQVVEEVGFEHINF